MSILDDLLAKCLMPDFLVRMGIRQLLAKKIKEETESTPEKQQARFMRFVSDLDSAAIAVKTETANSQHYEVPTEFFKFVLGPCMKYSSGYWPKSTTTFAESEEAMLQLTCERAELQDGQEILELGCGWGSLSLWMAEHYPQARITGVSNSRTQKIHIDAEATRRGLTNLTIITANMNTFETDGSYDRVISVEMFEHMKNYRRLMEKIARWMKPGGRLFVHIFTHRKFAYHFDGTDPSDWITRYFFEGGTMPSDDLLLYFQDDLHIRKHWQVDGTHYQKTSEEWLKNMDANEAAILPILSQTYGAENVTKWKAYWRVFFLSCAELWGYRNGSEWIISHYLFEK